MSIGVRNMKDTITYWAITGTDRFGKTTFSAPAALLGRWEDRIEQVQGKNGDVITSKSRIFLASAVLLEGYLYKGTSAAADPTQVQNASEIQALARMTDLRAVSNLYVAYL